MGSVPANLAKAAQLGGTQIHVCLTFLYHSVAAEHPARRNLQYHRKKKKNGDGKGEGKGAAQ